MELAYRGSLRNGALTDDVCSGECLGSLAGWLNEVTARCRSKTVDGSVPHRLGGYPWAGFNETCVRDPRTRQYCNGIIANSTAVPDHTQMPRAELCHTCHVRRLARMQASQCSVEAGDTCGSVYIRAGIEAGLFRRVNPSLAVDSCTASLQPRTAPCVGPTYAWDATAPSTMPRDLAGALTLVDVPAGTAVGCATRSVSFMPATETL